MGMTMTLDRDTDRVTDLETIWAGVGASMERFVRRRISDPHHADDVVAEVMLRNHIRPLLVAQTRRGTHSSSSGPWPGVAGSACREELFDVVGAWHLADHDDLVVDHECGS
jgi:hypothetical protein